MEEVDTLSGREQSGWHTFRASGVGVFFLKCEHTFVDWITPIFEDLYSLLDLPPNWDSYGASQIEKQCIVTALEILTISPGTSRPSVVPAVDGGLQLEWHTACGIDLEIEIEPLGKGHVYYEGPSEEVVDRDYNPRADLSFLKELMDRLPRHS
jgi:hypothetical protein